MSERAVASRDKDSDGKPKANKNKNTDTTDNQGFEAKLWAAADALT
jgi:hypothetical protein